MSQKLLKFIDMIVLYDLKGNILDADEGLLDWLGYSKAELLSVGINDLHSSKDSKSSRQILKSDDKNGFVRRKTSFKKKNGEILSAEVSANLFEIGKKKIIRAIVRDINDTKRAEEELEKRHKDLKIINTITQAVHQPLDIKKVYKIALDMTIELENVDMACIYLVDKHRKQAVLKGHRNFPEHYIRNAQIIPYPKGITWKAINTGEVIYVKDAQKDPHIGPAGRDLGHHSILGIPINLEGIIIGVIWLVSYKERQFNKQEIDLFSSIGNQIALAIAKAKLYKDLFKKNRDEKIISTVTQCVHQSLELQEVLENAADVLIKNLDVVDNVSIYQVEGEEAVIKAHRGIPKWCIERAGRIPYPKGFTWKVVIDGKPRYCPDTKNDKFIGPAGKDLGINSYLSMPIKYENKNIGVINLTSINKNSFDKTELKLMEVVSNQIGIAINKSKTAEALKNSEIRYRTFFDNNPLMCFNVDMDGKVLSVNGYGANQLGYTPEELIGQSVLTVFHPDDKEAVQEQMKSCLNNDEQVAQWEFRKVRKDGSVLWVKEDVCSINDPNGNLSLLIVCEDITDRKKAHQALKSNFELLSKKNRYEKIISTVTQSVHQSIDLQKVLENAVEAMSKNIDVVEHIGIHLVEGKEAVMRAHRGHPDWFVKRVKRIPYPKGFTWKTIMEGKPRYCPDVDKDTFIGPAGREVGTKSYVSMPIEYESETVGCINVHSFQKNAFDEEELKLLEIVAHQIETAINNAKHTEALRQSEERYRILFDQSPHGVHIFDKDLKITNCNERFVQIIGSSREKIVGLDMKTIKDKCFNPIMERALRGEIVHHESLYETTTSEVKLWLSVRVAPLRGEDGDIIGGMAVVENITQRKRQEEQIHHLAMHDYMTDLPNRRALEEHLHLILNQTKFKHKGALVVMDLDNFKIVNDTLGHLAGDQLLIDLTKSLRGIMRPNDLLARVGGDEFAMVLQDVSFDEAKKIADRLYQVVNEFNFNLIGFNFRPSLSMGISLIDSKSDSQTILEMAYSALYRAKSEGKNRIVIFHDEDRSKFEFDQASQWGFRIQEALKENRFKIEFEPVVRLDSGKTEYFEALVRMQDKSGQMIYPKAFIPTAERFGLISQIDRWVVKSVINLLNRHTDLRIFVNLSGSSLRCVSLLELIENNIKGGRISAGQLNFEITEFATIRDITNVHQWMSKLNDLECSFSLDDFGMGYSSFTHLQNLPVNYVKIDVSFISKLSKEPSNLKIVESIVAVSHALDKEVIAEGVENENVTKILRDLNVEYGQGYHWKSTTLEKLDLQE